MNREAIRKSIRRTLIEGCPIYLSAYASEQALHPKFLDKLTDAVINTIYPGKIIYQVEYIKPAREDEDEGGQDGIHNFFTLEEAQNCVDRAFSSGAITIRFTILNGSGF